MTQFSLKSMVKAVPETIGWLRGQLTQSGHAGGEAIATSAPSSRPPCNVDLIDAADLQLEALAFWAEEAGVSTRNVGLAWRRPDGTIRGILRDDSRPADTIAHRLQEAMAQPGWVEPDGMSDHLHRLLAKHSRHWNTLTDLLYEAAA